MWGKKYSAYSLYFKENFYIIFFGMKFFIRKIKLIKNCPTSFLSGAINDQWIKLDIYFYFKILKKMDFDKENQYL